MTSLVDRIAQHYIALGDCNGYLVLVADPLTGDVDAYGPFTGEAAVLDADRRRRELDSEGLHEVAVRLARFHHVPVDAVSGGSTRRCTDQVPGFVDQVARPEAGQPIALKLPGAWLT